jgi:hypothetical protein
MEGTRRSIINAAPGASRGGFIVVPRPEVTGLFDSAARTTGGRSRSVPAGTRRRGADGTATVALPKETHNQPSPSGALRRAGVRPRVAHTPPPPGRDAGRRTQRPARAAFPLASFNLPRARRARHRGMRACREHTFRPASLLSPPLTHPHTPTAPLPSPADLERRLAYLQERQAAYDRYAAAPRAVPGHAYSEAAFVRQLDAVMGGNELTRRAAAKVAMHEAMLRQKAQARHFDWTKRVYEPLSAGVSDAVAAAFPRVHAMRQSAHADFLKATATRTVYLDDLVKPGDYDPYELARGGAVRARVGKLVDPLKRVVEKTWEEAELVARPTYRAARVKETLPPGQWTKECMEATPFGHFEARDVAGGFTMAFAGKDNESTVAFRDYDAPLARAHATGRQPDLDAEFPVGKRQGYVYANQPTAGVVEHLQHSSVYAPGEAHSDGGGARLDNTIADVMRAAK